MQWTVFCLILCAAVIGSVFALRWSFKRTGSWILRPMSMAIICVAGTLFLGLLPKNWSIAEIAPNSAARMMVTIGLSVVNTIQCFTVDMDGIELMETINKESFALKGLYIFLMNFLCTIAPLLSMSAIIAALLSFSARIKYFLRWSKPVCIFSEMNERSMALAADIYRQNPKMQIVFTDVLDKSEEQYYDLTGTAKALHAILFKEDILTPRFHRHLKTAEISFFVMGDSETENIDHALTLIERFRSRGNTRLYLFSSSRESEMALSGVNKGSMKVRRINETQSFVYHTLYESGSGIFQHAVEKDGVKEIHAVIVGMGNFGTEMLKALAWYCQMDGYRVYIDAFDKCADAEDRFAALCPDLLNPKYNGISESGESEYHITIHPAVDAETAEFRRICEEIGTATYVFVAAGSDEDNVKLAADMRMIWKRIGCEPLIHAVVRSSNTADILQSSVNYKGVSYGIDYVGSLVHNFSAQVIISSDLEKIALQRHMKYGADEASFWDYEYNYRSSVASVIHMFAREYCHINDALNAKGVDGLSEDEREKLQKLEHCRWNAYLRGEGYTWGEKRDDIAKKHHCLVNYSQLSQKDIDKDLWSMEEYKPKDEKHDESEDHKEQA